MTPRDGWWPRLVATADVRGASFYNFMWYSDAWWELSPADRDRIKDGLPVRRTSGSPPGDGHGYWAADKAYSAGMVGVSRHTYRPFE